MIVVAFSIILLAWITSKIIWIGKREQGLPPGPPTVFLIGNLHMFPTQFAHFKLTEWARRYGEIYSLKMASGTVIVLSSAAAVKDLMDKQSAITVDRPSNHMADVVTGGLNIGLAKYTDDWRSLRKTVHVMLSPQASSKYLPIQRAEAIQLMHDIVHTPQDFFTHFSRYSISVIFSILYGKRCPRYETKDALAFLEVQHLWEHTLEPGAHPPVDLLPFLKYVPERWAPWKRLCADVRKRQRDLYFGLLTECEERLGRGEENGCYIEEVLARHVELDMSRELVGYLGGACIEAGVDTTTSFLQSLVLLLVAFPEVQRKAHDEMDRVVSDQRLPSLEDFESMPYIQALIKETHRFRPVAPLGVPHATISESEYRGYIVPRGATIFVNAWAIFHDPEVFDEPEIFNPDRYIRSEYGTKVGVDDRDFRHTLVFGSGRRICPGMHLANNSLMLNTMNLIWAFNFDQAVDAVTKLPIAVDTFDYQRGLLTNPKPFKCRIVPRSRAKVELIEQAFMNASEIFSRFVSSIYSNIENRPRRGRN